MSDWRYFYTMAQHAEFNDDIKYAYELYHKAALAARTIGEERIAWQALTRCEKMCA